MNEWALALVLPNLRLPEAIEGVEVALVPRQDQRVIALEAAHDNIGPFLNRFTDAFRLRVEPTVKACSSMQRRSIGWRWQPS